jgi:hypothetical protein
MLATFSIHGNALNSRNAARGASLTGDKGLAFAQLLTAINRGASDYEDRRLCRPSVKATDHLHPAVKNEGFTFSMGYLTAE